VLHSPSRAMAGSAATRCLAAATAALSVAAAPLRQTTMRLTSIRPRMAYRIQAVVSPSQRRGCAARATNEASAAGASSEHVPEVTLFTKPGCTLCDKALAVLRGSQRPYRLRVVNIEENGCEDWNARYWCDIPVFHVDGKYWTKHKLDSGSVDVALSEAVADGAFVAREGEPDMRGLAEPPAAGEDGQCGCEGCVEGEECCGDEEAQPSGGVRAAAVGPRRLRGPAVSPAMLAGALSLAALSCRRGFRHGGQGRRAIPA